MIDDAGDPLVEAFRLQRDGHAAQAVDWLDAESVRSPADPAARILAARFLVLRGDAEGALERLSEVPTTGDAGEASRCWRGLARLFLGDLESAEPLLREELASGPSFRVAGLALARGFRALELQDDARAILDAAQERAPKDVDLALARADLLRDLFLRDAAEQLLRVVLRTNPTCDEAWVALAELTYEQARDDDCRAALAQVAAAPDPAVQARRDRVSGFLTEAGSGSARPIEARALLAAVRGATRPEDRRAALGALLSDPATRDAGFSAAIAHGDALLRRWAVEALAADTDDATGLLDRAIADADREVRLAVVRKLAAVRDTEAVLAALVDRIQAEADPGVFRALHDSLCSRLGPRVDLPFAAESAPQVRANAAQAWRKVWAERSW